MVHTSPPSSVLQNYNFRLLWLGQGFSLLGDQFFLVALPWLVLTLTNDPLALGTVLALVSIPRALVMLVGGAVTDRTSPRLIMLVSDLLRLALVSLLTALIITSTVQLWMLYLMAVLFGLISGFFMPASSTMVPRLVKSDQLLNANAIYQGTSQLITFLGPVLGGALIALFAHSALQGTPSEMLGIAAAMAFDALSFAVSVITLWLMRWQSVPKPAPAAREGMLTSITSGISFLWQGDLLRTMFLLMVAANFIFAGPVGVGMPVLVNSKLVGGAASYGLILGAYGGGNLLGISLSSRVIKFVRSRLGAFMVGVIVSFGVALVLLGLVSSVAACFAIFFVVGIGNGILAIAFITFLQQNTPREMLGRVMSLVSLAGVGLVPISQALAGALTRLSLEYMFIGAGLLMLLVAAWLAAQPVTRTMHAQLTAEPKV